jgi:hypothetical protein
MAFNVMDMIQGSLTSENIGAVAGALGMDNDIIKKGLGAAMPAVLGGLLGAAKTPQGRQTLDSALASADTDMLGNLGNLLSGDGSSSMISLGSKLLTDFMGDQNTGALGGALASGLGISKESSGSLLGLAAPMVMSMLAGKKKSEGLDTGGLISSLMDQKGLIAKAIPDGIGKQLAGSGILDDIMGDAGAAVASASASVQSAANVAQDTAAKSGSPLRWVIWVVVILAILYFVSNMLGGDRSGDRTSMVGAEEMTVAGVNLGDAVTNIFDDLGTALGSITDASSARAALPDLNQVQDKLGTVERAAASLSPAGKSALAGAIRSATPAIEKTANKLLGDSAIAPIVKPALDDIMRKLSAIAGT